MLHFSPELLTECKLKLLAAKTALLDQVRELRTHLASHQTSGDEGDLSRQAHDEAQALIQHHRLREQLLEVEHALARMERGNYGICEETNEPIEVERLLALPWTRLSIEGAEIRERLVKLQIFR